LEAKPLTKLFISQLTPRKDRSANNLRFLRTYFVSILIQSKQKITSSLLNSILKIAQRQRVFTCIGSLLCATKSSVTDACQRIAQDILIVFFYNILSFFNLKKRRDGRLAHVPRVRVD